LFFKEVIWFEVFMKLDSGFVTVFETSIVHTG
jgi:hypothetical protein